MGYRDKKKVREGHGYSQEDQERSTTAITQQLFNKCQAEGQRTDGQMDKENWTKIGRADV